jgi:hypothetical protein
MIDGIANQVQPPQEIVQIIENKTTSQAGIPTPEKEIVDPTVVKDNIESQPKSNIPVPKPNQYLIVVDDYHMAMLSKLMPGVLFVLVEGMTIKDNPNHQVLVNPLPKGNQTLDNQSPNPSA